MLRHHHFNHTDIFEEDTKLKCLEDFFFFLRFLFINLGYVEFDMSHYNHVTFQSFSLIEQSTSETISTSGHWLPAVWPPLPVVFGCCCCFCITNSSDVFTNLFHKFFSVWAIERFLLLVNRFFFFLSFPVEKNHNKCLLKKFVGSEFKIGKFHESEAYNKNDTEFSFRNGFIPITPGLSRF